MPELRRFALLIGGKDIPGHSKLKGIEKDLFDFSRHLIGERGGAWEKDEIKFLIHPKRNDVLSSLALAKDRSDYCIVVYGGHGCHYKKPLDDTAVCLSADDEILARELNPRTPRHLVILDTCRQLTDVVEPEERSILAFSAVKEAHIGSYRQSCRELFDSHLQKAAEGRCVAYACAKNQTAGDSDDGGHFTQSMLVASQVFHEKGNFKVRAKEVQTLTDTFEIAREMVNSRNYPQNPVLEEGRRMTSFPFAVK